MPACRGERLLTEIAVDDAETGGGFEEDALVILGAFEDRRRIVRQVGPEDERLKTLSARRDRETPRCQRVGE